MGIRDYIGRIGSGVRNYFSRGHTVPQQDERGRNAQVGYQQRRNWLHKFFDNVGAVAKYVGLTAAALTGVGAIAWGIQYIRGRWPHTENPRPEFIITQNAITEQPARPLSPGVPFYWRPFVRIVEENGRPATISAQQQNAETPDYKFRSLEGSPVTARVQYNYQVSTPEGAAKVFWDFGGLEKAHETIDTIVDNALLNELASVPVAEIARGYKLKQGGEEVDFLIAAENRANAMLRKERAGIVVTNFALADPRFSPEVEAAWQAPFVAQRIREEERGRADARIIEAQSESQQSDIIYETTMRQVERTNSMAQTLFPDDPEARKQFIFQMATLTGNIRMVNEGANPYIITGGFGQAQMPYVFINTADVNRQRNAGSETIDAKKR